MTLYIFKGEKLRYFGGRTRTEVSTYPYAAGMLNCEAIV